MTEQITPPPQPRHQGIYLLPNLLTTAALFAGFYGIIAAIHGHFQMACVSIFLAMIMDSLDGRIARLTHTQSLFGAEYDSLSDMIAFGIAPALIMYFWSLSYLGKFGWIIAFVYVAATALRLARFNTQPNADKRYFQGLPCTCAAPVVITTIWVTRSFHLDPTSTYFIIINSVVLLLAALLMVSRVRYSSFKEIDMKGGRVPFVAILGVVAVFVAIAIDPPEVLFAIFMGYALSGPLLTLRQLRKRRSIRQRLKNRRKGEAKNGH